ncbi:MAG: inorganic phosphate transporter [Oscillospiraceae bacterium]
MFVFILIILLLTFINGFTDAVNAVLSTITTKIYTTKKAVLISGVYNFLGCIIFCLFFNNVTKSIIDIAGLEGVSVEKSFIGLSCAMISVCIWSFIAFLFAVPTSESHGIIAGLCGVSLAINGVNGFDLNEVIKMLKGQVVSIIVGLVLGFVFNFIFTKKREMFYNKINIDNFLKNSMFTQSFLHGAQDGQKFFALIILAFTSLGFKNDINRVYFILLISLVMTQGILLGGNKIVKEVSGLANLNKSGWAASDCATMIGILISTLKGVPVSTTYIKVSSVFGAGIYLKTKIDKKSFYKMVVSWVLTFPICFCLAYVLYKMSLNYIFN